MQIEQMEQILGQYIITQSTKLGQPLRQRLALVKDNTGIKVGQETIELSVNLITGGASLEELVNKMMRLNWLLFTKQREEKERLIEKNKQLATAYLNELNRLTPTDDFNAFIESFKKGQLVERKGKQLVSVSPRVPTD